MGCLFFWAQLSLKSYYVRAWPIFYQPLTYPRYPNEWQAWSRWYELEYSTPNPNLVVLSSNQCEKDNLTIPVTHLTITPNH